MNGVLVYVHFDAARILSILSILFILSRSPAAVAERVRRAGQPECGAGSTTSATP